MLNKDKEYTNFKFPTIFQEFIYTRTYSRWLEEEGRRESWEETVKRYIDYMKEKLGDKITAKEAKDVYQAILNFEVMPSMRALWAAGGAADADNLALYNCSFIAIENLKNFAEILYILMNGTGAGFTVEKEYISKLPIVSEEVSAGPIVPIIFEDSKQGWAKGFEQVLHCLWAGLPFECDYSKIRPRGARLKTMGGRASGPEPLKELIRFVTEIAERNRGHQIQSIDAHDICCKIADIVVVGGVRRCLPYNALIPTSNGVKQIKDIVAGDLIETGGEYHIVKGKVFSGKQTTLIIKHAFGEIECTPRHKIAIFESNSTTFKYKMAKDIKKGDCLVWDSLGYSGKKTELPKFNEKYHFNSKKFIIPEITTDIAWLIGLIHGDGHIAERTIEITANTKERVVLECAKDIFKKFNLNSKISKGNGDCLRLRVHSAALCRWFTQHIKKANKDIYIPSFIRDAEKEIRSAYLAGLFDADGRSRNDGVCEQATTIYKSFSDEVTALLAGLGIGSSIYEGSAENRRLNNIEAKDFYSIIVKGITNRQKWVNTIGIYTKGVKSAKIGTIIGSPVDFKYKASMLGYPEGWRKEGYVTLASAVEHGFIENPIYYPTVVENITEGVEIDTYDIEIDGVCRFTTGGLVVHNSACISLSDLDDRTMANAKKGEFWNSQPQRMLANNSAVYNRKPSVSMFLEEWKHLYQSNSGERGIFNRMAGKKKAAENHRRDASKIQGTNPCGEILLRSAELCNLSEVVVRPEDTFDTLKQKVKLATVIGTWQATFTNFNYIDSKWKENCDEEKLLGVSLTGLRDHPILGFVNDTAKKWLADLKHVSIQTNKKTAQRLGINRAAAITCVKPSGTVSLLVDSAPGAHVRQTKTGYYIRRVRISATDPLFKMLGEQGMPFQCEVGQSPESCNTYVLEFVCKAPTSANREKETAIEQLEYWKMVRTFWCEHNPSITVSVKEDEWLDTAAWVYKNFDDICGVSFLPSSDHVYLLAPYEDVTKEQYEKLVKEMPQIDFTKLSEYELEDATQGSKEYACQGGSCEII